MKKISLIASIAFVCFMSSCEKRLSVVEKITEKGAKINIKSYQGKYLSSNWDMLIYADKDVASGWEEFFILPVEGGKYVLQAYTGKYLSADLGSNQEIGSNRDKYSDWELFDLVEINDSTIALKAGNQKYITVSDDAYKLFATGDTTSIKEQFILTFINQQ